MSLPNWKRVVGQRIRGLDKERAKQVLDRIQARRNEVGATIDHPAIRELTGGYASQSINAYVIRKLAVKAGIIRGE